MKGNYWDVDYTDPVGRGVRQTFGNRLPRIKKGRILDWGCNDGSLTKELTSIYPSCEVIGIDIKPELIEQARVNAPNARFLVADGYNPPFKPHSFKAVFCMNNLAFAMEDMAEKKTKHYLKSIEELVEQKGNILVSRGSETLIFTPGTGRFSHSLRIQFPKNPYGGLVFF